MQNCGEQGRTNLADYLVRDIGDSVLDSFWIDMTEQKPWNTIFITYFADRVHAIGISKSEPRIKEEEHGSGGVRAVMRTHDRDMARRFLIELDAMLEAKGYEGCVQDNMLVADLGPIIKKLGIKQFHDPRLDLFVHRDLDGNIITTEPAFYED